LKTLVDLGYSLFCRRTEQYSYGFNGKENDNEVVGTGSGTQDYGLRIYNPALGRFLSLDPLSKNFPWMSPYHFAGNTPIQAIDLEGAEILNKVFVMVDEQGTTYLTNPNGSKVVEITNNNPWSGQKDVTAYFVKKKGSGEFTFYDSKNPGDAEAKMRADGVKFGKPKITEQMMKAPKVNKEIEKGVRTMKNYVTAVMLPLSIEAVILNPKNIIEGASLILDADELIGGATNKDSYIESQISTPEGKAAFNGIKAAVDMTGRTNDVLGLDKVSGGTDAAKTGASIIKGTADVADDATSAQENLKKE
jgi:RHS repeat-associated protein